MTSVSTPQAVDVKLASQSLLSQALPPSMSCNHPVLPLDLGRNIQMCEKNLMPNHYIKTHKRKPEAKA